MAQRDSALKFVCPVCEASPQERCHVNARILCFESHWERRELATNMTSATGLDTPRFEMPVSASAALWSDRIPRVFSSMNRNSSVSDVKLLRNPARALLWMVRCAVANLGHANGSRDSKPSMPYMILPRLPWRFKNMPLFSVDEGRSG